MEPTIDYIFWTAAGYLSGSIMYAYLLPLLFRHVDIRSLSDDQNPGAANAFKHAGIPIGCMVICCELLKGFLPVWLACKYVDMGRLSFTLVMIAPVLGHAFPLFWKGRYGGKSIAVSFGVLLGFFPDLRLALLLAVFYLLFSLVLVIQPHLVRSVLTYTCFCISCVALGNHSAVIAGCVLLSFIVIGKHVAKYRGEKFSLRLFRFSASSGGKSIAADTDTPAKLTE